MKKFIFGSLTAFIALAIFSGCQSMEEKCEKEYTSMQMKTPECWGKSSKKEDIAADIKQDATLAISVVPAWYTGQMDARIDKLSVQGTI